MNQSPFNVGLPFELANFSLEQVRDLASRYELGWADSFPAEKLMAMVGRHQQSVGDRVKFFPTNKTVGANETGVKF